MGWLLNNTTTHINTCAYTESSCCICPPIHVQQVCIIYLDWPIQFYYTYNYISLFICIVDVTLVVQESSEITSNFFSVYNLEKICKYTMSQAVQDTITVCVCVCVCVCVACVCVLFRITKDNFAKVELGEYLGAINSQTQLWSCHAVLLTIYFPLHAN